MKVLFFLKKVFNQCFSATSKTPWPVQSDLSYNQHYKSQKNKKLPLNSELQTFQILASDDLMLILCLSYFLTTLYKYRKYLTPLWKKLLNRQHCARLEFPADCRSKVRSCAQLKVLVCTPKYKVP